MAGACQAPHQYSVCCGTTVDWNHSANGHICSQSCILCGWHASFRCGGRPVSAKHAVLGLVIERPGYGYDLACRLRERFGSSGFAPTGVYSALDQLSAEGLVRPAGPLLASGAERAAPRTVYEATADGIDRFDRWMASTSPLANVRDELNMKLALSRPCDLPALIRLVTAQERECLERLATSRKIKARADGGLSERHPGLRWREVTELLVREAETRQLQARVEWLQRARAVMVRLAEGAEDSVASGRAVNGCATDGGVNSRVASSDAAAGRGANGRVAINGAADGRAADGDAAVGRTAAKGHVADVGVAYGRAANGHTANARAAADRGREPGTDTDGAEDRAAVEATGAPGNARVA